MIVIVQFEYYYILTANKTPKNRSRQVEGCIYRFKPNVRIRSILKQ